ncbi:Ger(x)C family germination protein [Paenibacillus methanolicus]|uniref:Ger(X)C family germination protein n=2 Tax=Paenibacillus methanolicus TaxID=582686 RepID=A0A5S5C3C4_9BACL|nr:Ger(x)C family germination protein [Paenibacillus methanolicus]
MFGSLLACSLMTGCWDSTNLETIDYATAIGVEYKEDKFVVYTQLVDFSSIAKNEGGEHKGAKVWVGRGVGDTFYGAYSELLRTAQTEMNTEQLKTVIIRDSAIVKLDEILDALNRVRVSRYTSWVFGTNTPVDEILTTSTFFGMPQTTSLIYSPRDQMRRANLIDPLSMQHFVARYNEGPATVLLPVVGVSTRMWKEEEQSVKMQVVQGMFAIKRKGKATYFPIGEMGGVKWVNPNFTRYLMPIAGEGGNKATIAVNDVKAKVRIDVSKKAPLFTIKLSVVGEVAEIGGHMSKEQIVARMKQVIKEEMVDTYRKGLAKGEDLYNLEEELYRHHLRVWRKETKGREVWLPGKDDLNVDVSFRLRGSGVFGLS